MNASDSLSATHSTGEPPRVTKAPFGHQNIINIGTRNSRLALVQANFASDTLSSAHPDLTFPLNTVMVRGDADKVTPFLLMADQAGKPDAAKNLWTEEMELKLCAGELDILVHSLKDLPTMLPEGCILGAVMQRADPTDALVVKPTLPYKTLAEFPAGSVVGTSSTRRKAILKRHYPELVVKECRGNVDTRLRKLDAEDGEFDCIILASAGLKRINLGERITTRLNPIDFPYAVGQGALGIEIREGDERISALVHAVEKNSSRWPCLAERSMLRTLQGGCSSPVGVWSFVYEKDVEDEEGQVTTKTMLRLHGRVIHPDGSQDVSCSDSAEVANDHDAEALGINVAQKLFAAGADKLLSEIRNIERQNFLKRPTNAAATLGAVPEAAGQEAMAQVAA